MTSLRLIVCVALLGVHGYAMAGQQPDEPKKGARAYLEFSKRYTAACAYHRGRLQLVENTHPSKAIEITYYSYLDGTRSQWRGRKRLDADAEPLALGCTASSGLPRHWEIVGAEFVSGDDDGAKQSLPH